MIVKHHTTSERQLYTILFIVFVGFIGISIAYPLFPPLFLNSDNSGLMANEWVASHRQLLLGLTLAVYPLGQFIGSPIIGALSDKYGRRRILLGSLVGTVFGYFLSALALSENSLLLLVTSRLFTGLAESSLALAQSIVGDLKDINKHRGFGSLMLAASLGYVIGPLIGGFLSDHHVVSWFNVSLPFYIATLLAMMTFVLAYYTLNETHNERSISTKSVWDQFNIWNHLRELTQNQLLKYLLISSLIFTLSVDLFYEFGPVYLTGRFEMNSAQIAIYNVLLSFSIAMGGIWLPVRLATKFSSRTIVIATTFIFSLILLAIIITSSMHSLLLLFILIGLMIPIPSTVMNVQLSDIAGQYLQGKMMGMQWGLRMLGDAIICLSGGFLIIYSVSFPLLLGIIAALLAIIIYSTKTVDGIKNEK